eukprot:UN10248
MIERFEVKRVQTNLCLKVPNVGLFIWESCGQLVVIVSEKMGKTC